MLSVEFFFSQAHTWVKSTIRWKQTLSQRYCNVLLRMQNYLVSGCVLRHSAVMTGLLYSLEAMWAIRSQTRLLYPNSLSYLIRDKKKYLNGNSKSIYGKRYLDLKVIHNGGAYHVTSFTKWSLRAMPAPASKMEE